jgi:hypothetical protein
MAKEISGRVASVRKAKEPAQEPGLEIVHHRRSIHRRRRRPGLEDDPSAEAEAEAAKLGALFRKQLGLRKST